MDIFSSVPFLIGAPPAVKPLSRFLPPIVENVLPDWLETVLGVEGPGAGIKMVHAQPQDVSPFSGRCRQHRLQQRGAQSLPKHARVDIQPDQFGWIRGLDFRRGPL